MTIFKSNFGRIVLHLLTYGLAAGAVAIITQLQSGAVEFGPYAVIVMPLLGAALDALRKYGTSL